MCANNHCQNVHVVSWDLLKKVLTLEYLKGETETSSLWKMSGIVQPSTLKSLLGDFEKFLVSHII